MISGPIAGSLVLFSAMALAYLWIHNRCEMIGRDIRKLEREKTTLTKQFNQEEYRWIEMKSPRNLDKALKKWNIDMAWPTAAQIVRIPVGRQPAGAAEKARTVSAGRARGDRVL